jgi:hypothetical protein
MVNKRDLLRLLGSADAFGGAPAAVAASFPCPIDPIMECQRLAGELADAMNRVKKAGTRSR